MQSRSTLLLLALLASTSLSVSTPSCGIDDRGRAEPSTSGTSQGGGGQGGEAGTGGTQGGMGGEAGTTSTLVGGFGGGCLADCRACGQGQCCKEDCGTLCTCKTGCACELDCAAPPCSASCESMSLCTGAWSNGSFTCDGAECVFACPDPGNGTHACSVSCRNGATCDGECAATQQCTCTAASKCTFRCAAPPCRAGCLGGSACVLDCSFVGGVGDDCKFLACQGTEKMCPNGRVACNAACP